MAERVYVGATGGKIMTWTDPIVDEVRQARDAYAARFNYDLRAIYRDLKEQEEQRAHRIDGNAKHPTEAEANVATGSEGIQSRQCR